MDEHLITHPTEGVRSMVNKMREYGFHVKPKRIRRLFRIMDYNAVYLNQKKAEEVDTACVVFRPSWDPEHGLAILLNLDSEEVKLYED